MNKYIIQMSPDQPFFLDSMDGTDLKWTQSRAKAWRMYHNEAKKRLAIVRQILPEAIMLADD